MRLTRKQFLRAGAAGVAALTPWSPAAAADGLVDARQHGARGDGVADDTAAIQAAIDAAPSGAGTVMLPPGAYRLTRPLQIIDDAPHHGRRGLRLLGAAGGASGGATGCTLEWDGPADAPMLRLWSRDCIVGHLAFRVMPGRRAAAAIDVDQVRDGSAACTNNTFEHLLVTSGRGALATGVVIGRRAVANVELLGFTDCYFEDVEDACVEIASTTGQSKAHRFYKCAFVRARSAIRQVTGSFVTFGCSFGYLTQAAVRLRSITDYIAINESDSEGCARLLACDGGSSASWAVKVSGGRFALNGLAADGRFIDFTNGGPLLLENVLFGETVHPSFRIRAAAAEPGAVLLSFGNVFPNDQPYDTSGRVRLIALGNRGRNAAGDVVTLDDEITAGADAQARLALATVASISGTAVKSQNLRGAVTVAASASGAPVVFARPERDASYFVVAVVSASSGRPQPGATRVSVSGKTPAGFQVLLEAPPGPGNSVTIDWLLVR